MTEDVETNKLIGKLAEKLSGKPELKPPEWSRFVKTGSDRERPPDQPDWWWIRAAAVLRKIDKNSNLGVSRLRKEYGGRKNLGHKPEHKRISSGAVMRKMLQQMEEAGLLRKQKGRGRMLTKEGMAFINEAAKETKGGK